MYQINSTYQLDDEVTAAKYRRAFYLQCLRTHLKAKRLKNQVKKAFRASNNIVEKCFYLAVIEELNNFQLKNLRRFLVVALCGLTNYRKVAETSGTQSKLKNL